MCTETHTSADSVICDHISAVLFKSMSNKVEGATGKTLRKRLKGCVFFFKDVNRSLNMLQVSVQGRSKEVRDDG